MKGYGQRLLIRKLGIIIHNIVEILICAFLRKISGKFTPPSNTSPPFTSVDVYSNATKAIK